MINLLATLRQAFHQFGRPHDTYRVRDLQHIDRRVTDLEQREQEIAARLRLLEIAGDPRGISRDDT